MSSYGFKYFYNHLCLLPPSKLYLNKLEYIIHHGGGWIGVTPEYLIYNNWLGGIAN